jgi:hypothetical protein
VDQYGFDDTVKSDFQMEAVVGSDYLDSSGLGVESFIDLDSVPRPAPLFEFGLSPFHQGDPFAVAMDRQSFDRILGSFYEYIYPICPVPDRETLVTDLFRKRELLPEQDEWRNMVLGLVAFTVVQVPRTILMLTREEAKHIVKACCERVREYLSREYDDISANRRKSIHWIHYTTNCVRQS